MAFEERDSWKTEPPGRGYNLEYSLPCRIRLDIPKNSGPKTFIETDIISAEWFVSTALSVPHFQVKRKAVLLPNGGRKWLKM